MVLSNILEFHFCDISNLNLTPWCFQVGEKFCSEEDLNGELWPKAPAGDTVINRTCPHGRVGYKSRTCEGSTWQPVFSKCVNLELSEVANNADVSIHGMEVKGSVVSGSASGASAR